MKKKFEVTGMMCASCQANVNGCVSSLEGVSFCNVSLLSKSMVVEYDDAKLKDAEIISAVEKAGYGCAIFVNQTVKQAQEKRLRELKKKRNKLILSVILLCLLMVFSMGPMIPPVMDAIDQSSHMELICVIVVAMQFVFLVPIIVLNWNHFSSGYKGLIKFHPNMDALVALGSTVSIIYGIYIFIMMCVSWSNGDRMAVMNYSMNIYIESAAMIPVFISIGKYFESKATQKTTASIASLVALTPETAYLMKDGVPVEVPTESLQEDDLVMVKPGESIPADGVIVDGFGNVDESAITGESLPIYRGKESPVIAATINRDGSFVFKVTKVGKDTTIGKIVSLVEEASESKAPMARLADKVSSIFVPTVIGIAICVFALWMIMSGCGIVGSSRPDVGLSVQLAVSVLVISCPCALGLATPVAIMVGTGKGAENGILIKSVEAFERLQKVDTILFDKTGTLTTGEMSLQRIVALGVDGDYLISQVANIEAHSEHPLSKAVVNYAKEKGHTISISESFEYIPGLGVKAGDFSVGNRSLMEQEKVNLGDGVALFEEISRSGLTCLFAAENGKLIGLLGVGDSPKPSADKAIQELKRSGKQIAIVTGDNKMTADAMAEKLGIDLVFAEVLPQDKESIVAKLQKDGRKVAMIGDGVNDAPALTKADVGIAIGAGTDVAIESSDIILVRNDPMDVVSAISLSAKVVKNIKENLSWAFFYNIVLIPLAAGALYWINVPANWFTGNLGHLVLTPMIGSMAMSLSSITVVLNALRLRLFKRKEK